MRKKKLKFNRIITILLVAAIMSSLLTVAPAVAMTAEIDFSAQNFSDVQRLSADIAANVATPNSITVSAQPATGGNPTADPAQAPPGALVTLSANPASGYTFVRWVADPADSVIFANANNGQTTFIMPNAAVVIRAEFQSGSGRDLVVNVGPALGSGVAGGRAGVGRTAAEASVAAAAAAANSGGRLNNAPNVSYLQAIAAAGQTFSRWVNVSGGGTINNPAAAITTFTMPTTGAGDVAVRAEFGQTRTVSVQRNNNAWGTAAANETSTAQHRRVNLTAIPASGFTFLQWEVAGTVPAGFNNDSIQNRTSATDAHFTMPNANVTVRAVFQSSTQAVTITTGGVAGATANARAPGVTQGTSIVVASNQTVTLNATAPSGHALANWEVIGSAPSGFSNASFANRFEQQTTFTMPTGSVQIRANFVPGNRVAVTSNNATLGTAVQSTGAATNGSTVTITATPTTGNRFVRWEAVTPSNITFANAENATTTFTMPSQATTVRAVFESGTQVVTASGGVSVSYTVSGANVTFQLPTVRVTELINATTAGSNIFVDMRSLSAATTAIFPREALRQLSNANRGLELRLPEGTIILNRDASSSVAGATGTGNVSVTLNNVVRGSLPVAQRDATTVSDRIVRVTINAAGQAVSTFDGTISVTVPYTGPTPVYAWRLTNAGGLESINVNHNASARTVIFFPDRLSVFVVGSERETGAPGTPNVPDTPDAPVIPSNNPFNDIREGQWFFNNVMFVYGAGLMGGTSENPPMFSPAMNLNRAMIVTILHRQEGRPMPTGTNPFTDVPSGQWFSDAVIWAAENNIVAGYGGRFNPLANITRQDLAVILMRYADFKGIDLSVVANYTGFNDSNRISGYAVEAVRRSFEAGIITGRAGNIFAPLDNSTRAEAAAMLHRFFTAN